MARDTPLKFFFNSKLGSGPKGSIATPGFGNALATASQKSREAIVSSFGNALDKPKAEEAGLQPHSHIAEEVQESPMAKKLKFGKSKTNKRY